MSEEVTYADLKFQDSGKKENTQEFGNFGIKGKILSYGCVVRWIKCGRWQKCKGRCLAP